jgi:hypothetical protein
MEELQIMQGLLLTKFETILAIINYLKYKASRTSDKMNCE